MAAGGHFGYPKITFDHISGTFQINTKLFFKIVLSFLFGILYVYILTKSEFISSCSRPAVGSNIVQITCATFFVNVF